MANRNGIPLASGMWKYNGHANDITTIIFDNSFANYYPESIDCFSYCRKLTTIKNIENFQTGNLTDMSGMFRDCSSLIDVDLSHFNTSKVKKMGIMFGDCISLKSLDLSNFDTRKVTHMNNMFEGCSSLETINLCNFETSEVTDMDFMFVRCPQLVSLDLSSFNTENLIYADWMFKQCSSLTTIYVSEKWSTETMRAHHEMFAGCIKLVGGNGTKFDPSHIDATYARIDTNEEPGYFSKKESSSLGNLNNTSITCSSHPIYNLFGFKQEKPNKGINIIGKRKVIIKH